MKTETLGERLKASRKQLNASQDTIAEALGITVFTWSKYENNHRVPGFEVIKKYCSTFKVDVNWLLRGKGNMFLKDSLIKELEEKNCLDRLFHYRKTLNKVDTLFEEIGKLVEKKNIEK